MMKKIGVLLTVQLLFLLALGLQVAKARGFSKADVDQFCQGSTAETTVGQQFDGQKALGAVLAMQAGKYHYPNQGALLLYASGRYLLKLPNGYQGIYGSDGDDLLASGGIVGGCSKEQLSEVIRKNQLTPSQFRLIKRYQ